jgi:hypothetical protein
MEGSLFRNFQWVHRSRFSSPILTHPASGVDTYGQTISRSPSKAPRGRGGNLAALSSPRGHSLSWSYMEASRAAVTDCLYAQYATFRPRGRISVCDKHRDSREMTTMSLSWTTQATRTLLLPPRNQLSSCRPTRCQAIKRLVCCPVSSPRTIKFRLLTRRRRASRR